MEAKISKILVQSLIISYLSLAYDAKPAEDSSYLTNLYNQFQNPQYQTQQPYYGSYQYTTPQYYGSNQYQYQQPYYYGTNQYANPIYSTNTISPPNTNYQNYYQTQNYLSTIANWWAAHYQNLYGPFYSGQYPVGSGTYNGNSMFSDPGFVPING